MAHEWTDGPYRHKHSRLMGANKVRTCAICGAKQEQECTSLWGRIVERRWRPLVGRCKKPPVDNLDGPDSLPSSPTTSPGESMSPATPVEHFTSSSIHDASTAEHWLHTFNDEPTRAEIVTAVAVLVQKALTTHRIRQQAQGLPDVVQGLRCRVYRANPYAPVHVEVLL